MMPGIERMRRPAARLGIAGAAALLVAALGTASRRVEAGPPQFGPPGPPPAPAKVGLLLNDPRASQGYTLIAPLNGTKTYLIDMQGRVVRQWASKYTAGQEAYLLDNGHLLRAARIDPREQAFAGAGQGGRVQEFDWDGKLLWDYKLHDDRRIAHHDVCRLPNGNVLMIVWEIKTGAEAVQAGRKPETVRGPWLADSIVEVRPKGKTGGEVVWEWHAWDHLIQDADPSKDNYGDVSKHPELIDVNFGDSEIGFPGGPGGPPPGGPGGPPPGGPPRDVAKKAEPKRDDEAKKKDLDRLKTIGYVGNPAARGNLGIIPDWTHVNAVAYNPDLDQILLSVRSFSEFWVIDHGTTTAEAKGHRGGRRGRGGDLLYRWGNPRAYRAGSATDQRLFVQHDAQWIPKGRPGAGHILVFNNGAGRPDGNYSSVDEIVPPVDAQGNYTREPGTAFGPREAVWSYRAPKKEELFSFIMSGANRLPNGNTLICESLSGHIIEVTPEGETVWRYANPSGGSLMGGFRPPGMAEGPPKLAGVLTPMLEMILQVTPEQRTKLDAMDKDVVARLEKVLDAGQKKQLLEARAGDPMGFTGFAGPGQVLPLPFQLALKLSDEQKAAVAAIQKDVDPKLDALLDDQQKDTLKQVRTMVARGGPRGGPPAGPGGPPGFGGPPGGPGGPPGGFGGNSIFRAYRYAKDDPGLAGRDLTPGKTVEELERPKKEAK